MNLLLNKTLFIAFCLLIFTSANSQSKSGLKAKIEINKLDEMVSINGYAKNESPGFKENVSYKLLVLKKSKSGNYSKNLQSGDFSILSNQKKLLSNVKINLQKGEILKIYLYLRKNNVLIAKDSATVTNVEKKLETTAINENSIEIKGLVIDEVKTKPGKDFYEYFYQLYNTKGSNYPFIVKIIEQPGFGRSSQVYVKIDGKLVYRFFTKPKEEYLKAQVRQAIRAVENYNKYRSNLYQSSNY